MDVIIVFETFNILIVEYNLDVEYPDRIIYKNTLNQLFIRFPKLVYISFFFFKSQYSLAPMKCNRPLGIPHTLIKSGFVFIHTIQVGVPCYTYNNIMRVKGIRDL